MFKPGMMLMNMSIDFVLFDKNRKYCAHEFFDFKSSRPIGTEYSTVMKHPGIEVYTNIFVEDEDEL